MSNLKIESNGRIDGTKVYIDNKPVKGVQQLVFNMTVKNVISSVMLKLTDCELYFDAEGSLMNNEQAGRVLNDE